MDGERKTARERERDSRRPSMTRGVERFVTQVQSSATACPRAVLAQQRQEAAGYQRLRERQVGWKNKQRAEDSSQPPPRDAHEGREDPRMPVALWASC